MLRSGGFKLSYQKYPNEMSLTIVSTFPNCITHLFNSHFIVAQKQSLIFVRSTIEINLPHSFRYFFFWRCRCLVDFYIFNFRKKESQILSHFPTLANASSLPFYTLPHAHLLPYKSYQYKTTFFSANSKLKLSKASHWDVFLSDVDSTLQVREK